MTDHARDRDSTDATGDTATSDDAPDGRRVPWTVDADWLATHADDADVSVVDVRDAWEYDGIGHVPGAVNVPFDSFRSDGDADVGMLPGASAWAQVMRDAGVERDDVLVAYDDTHGVFAARFLVTALMYGHRDVALLDGDYAAYNQRHETTTDAPAVAASDYEATVPDDRPLIDADAVQALLDATGADGAATDDDGREVVFVDTRDDHEYDDGHLPGAVNLDWKALVDDETRGLLPEPERREVLEAHGITPAKRVVLYCNTARRISHTYVVLRALGYEHVDFFEGSLTEWRERDGALETSA
ncbi:sulfurtransferase [Halorubellus salinus]|uniref:sulfurtransferase n=1 Tax=Halorubellus salinus TaxID=755309 RepID=UPI001D0981FD|nr:rhodanese-like domain-containing protein [Halorubellus salinus]